MNAEEVILVVDRAYARQVSELPASAALWIVDSQENHPWISELKKKFTPDVRGDLTWFRDMPLLSQSDLAAQMLETIEEHHGEYSQQPAFAHLMIIGAIPEPRLLAVAGEIGFKLASSKEQVTRFERSYPRAAER